MNDSLRTTLRKLRLSGLAETLEVRLHEAASNQLTHAEFLEMILQDELLVRQDRQIARRVKAAAFRELKNLEDFNWSFNPSIKKNQMYDLARGRFLREHRDVLLCAPPGTGKSFGRIWSITQMSSPTVAPTTPFLREPSRILTA